MSNTLLKKAQASLLPQVLTTIILLVILFALFSGYIKNQEGNVASLDTLLIQTSNQAIDFPEWSCEIAHCFEKEKLRALDDEYISVFGRSKITLMIFYETTSETIVLYDALTKANREYSSLKQVVQVKEKENIYPGILFLEMRR